MEAMPGDSPGSIKIIRGVRARSPEVAERLEPRENQRVAKVKCAQDGSWKTLWPWKTWEWVGDIHASIGYLLIQRVSYPTCHAIHSGTLGAILA